MHKVPFPIDFVYTWVDDQDPIWQKRWKQAYSKKDIPIKSNESCRYANSDELLFSIRSLFQNCPWFHKIYIITDNQRPTWLNTEDSRIEIVDHTTIFGDKGTLPCFNSSVIESRLHHISTLSKHFITLNDDFFIGKPLAQSFFFSDDGTPKLYMSTAITKKQALANITDNAIAEQDLYFCRLNSSIKLVYEATGSLALAHPIHNPRPFRKADFQAVEQLFQERVAETYHHQFRNRSGLSFIGLCQFYMISKGMIPIITKPYRRMKWEYRFSFMRKNREYLYIGLGTNKKTVQEKYEIATKYTPAFICINDTNKSNNEDRKEMTTFLQELYPNPTSAEKNTI